MGDGGIRRIRNSGRRGQIRRKPHRSEREGDVESDRAKGAAQRVELRHVRELQKALSFLRGDLEAAAQLRGADAERSAAADELQLQVERERQHALAFSGSGPAVWNLEGLAGAERSKSLAQTIDYLALKAREAVVNGGGCEGRFLHVGEDEAVGAAASVDPIAENVRTFRIVDLLNALGQGLRTHDVAP